MPVGAATSTPDVAARWTRATMSGTVARVTLSVTGMTSGRASTCDVDERSGVGWSGRRRQLSRTTASSSMVRSEQPPIAQSAPLSSNFRGIHPISPDATPSRPAWRLDSGHAACSRSVSILGTRVLRIEDPKFLTTGGVYADDLRDPRLAGAGHVTYVRSVMAH